MPRARSLCALAPAPAFVLVLVLAPALARAAAMRARIVAVDARGFDLAIAGERVRAEDLPDARYWRDRAPAERRAFLPGETVVVRLRTAGPRARLREIADPPSAAWLAERRGGISRGTVAALGGGRLTLALDGGARFAFRVAPGTLRTNEPRVGDEVWVRGRASGDALDPTAAEISPRPIAPAPSVGPGDERVVEGEIRLVSPEGDEIVLTPTPPAEAGGGSAGGRSLVLPVSAATTVWDEGARRPLAALRPGTRVRVEWTAARGAPGRRGKARIRRIEILEFP